MKHLAYHLAHENMGIYPQYTVDEKGVRTERTEWQNGWNAFSLKEIKTVCEINDWFKALSEEHQELIEELIIADKLEISYRGEGNEDVPQGVSLWINCSDTFFWASADGEGISREELPELLECYKLSPQYGGDLWCARKRQMRPQTACYEIYPKEEWCLFDAAGEPRTDTDGIGREKLQ